MKNPRIVFMGTPDFSVPILESLIEHYQVVGVVTQPDKEVGRKRILTPPPVKELALQHGIPVFQPRKIRLDYQTVLDWQPDLIITCAYGQIIPTAILEFPVLGCINVHASLLPKLRGGAPIQKSIIDGYRETGITIMEMVDKMDAGDIISQVMTPITDEDTYGTLHDRLRLLGRDLLLEILPSILEQNYEKKSQVEEEVTFGYNIKREEEKIDFTQSARTVFNQVRGLNPIPGAYTLLDGKTMKLFACTCEESEKSGNCGEIVTVADDHFDVMTGSGILNVFELQMEGKKKMSVRDYFHGVKKETLLGKVLQ